MSSVDRCERSSVPGEGFEEVKKTYGGVNALESLSALDSARLLS